MRTIISCLAVLCPANCALAQAEGANAKIGNATGPALNESSSPAAPFGIGAAAVQEPASVASGSNDYIIFKLSGDGQGALAGQWTPAPLEVGVWSENGPGPSTNVPVDFSLVAGGGWLAGAPGAGTGTSVQIFTDIDGIAQVWHRQPGQADVQSTITASALGRSVTFTAYSLAATANTATASDAVAWTPSGTETLAAHAGAYAGSFFGTRQYGISGSAGCDSGSLGGLENERNIMNVNSASGFPQLVLLTPAMTGNTAPLPFSVSTNSTNASSNPWMAFDRDATGADTSFHSGYGETSDLWLALDFGVARSVRNIKIYSRPSGYQQDTPSEVVTSYSSDGVTWTHAVTVSGIPTPGADSMVFFDEDMAFGARYVKFTFNNTRSRGYIVLSEIELYGPDEPQQPPPDTPQLVLLTPAMTGNTTPAPYAVTSNSTGDSNGPPWRAFDRNKGVLFHSGHGQQNDWWVAMDLCAQKDISNIKIYSREQISYQHDTPSQVTVSHSADGTSWTVAKTISGIAQPTSVGALFFDEDVNIQARHVKFSFVNARSNQRGYQVIGEIELYGPDEPQQPPAVPSSFAVATGSQTTIVLTWAGSTDASVTYEIERSAAGVTFAKINDVTGSLTYTDTGLAPGVTYYYRILARNSGGASAYTATLSATTTAAVLLTPPMRGNAAPSPWVVSAASVWDSTQKPWCLFSQNSNSLYASGANTFNTSTGLSNSPQWVMIYTGGRKHTLTSIVLRGRGDYLIYAAQTPRDFEIQTSLDGQSWTTILSATDVAAPTTLYQVFYEASVPDVEFVYLRMEILRTGAGQYNSSFGEIELHGHHGPPLQPPTTPGNPTIGAVTNTSITLTWTGSTDASITYEIERSTDGITFAKIDDVTGALSYTDSGLTPGVTYYYRILARNSGGASAYTATLNATTTAAVLLTPPMRDNAVPSPWVVSAASVWDPWQKPWCLFSQNSNSLYASGANTFNTSTGLPNSPQWVMIYTGGRKHTLTSIVLRGRGDYLIYAPSAPRDFEIQTSLDGQSWTTILSATDVAAPTALYQVFYEASVPSVEFVYLRMEILKIGEGWRNGSFGELELYGHHGPPPQPPTTPGDPTVGAVTNTSITLAWTGSTDASITYEIERSADGVTFSKINDITGALTYTDTGLDSGATYYYRILACNDSGASAHTAVLSATTELSVARPADLEAGLGVLNTVILTWQNSATPGVNYEIERKAGNGAYERIASVASGRARHVDSLTESSVTYAYRIRAVLDGDASAYSSEVSITTNATSGAAVPATGLRLWLAPESLEDKPAVNIWLDQSGWANNARAGSETAAPTREINSINGHASVGFSHAGKHYLQLPDVLESASEGEVFIVVKSTPVAGQFLNLWKWSSGPANGSNWYPNNHGVLQEAFGDGALRTMGAPIADLSEWHVYNVSAKTGRFTARLNGVEQFAAALDGVAFSTAPLLGRGPSLYFNGRMAEVLAYDRVLSAEERKGLEQHLAGKYALASTGAPSAPANVRPYAMSATQAAVTWSSDKNDWAVFEIERREREGFFEKVGETRGLERGYFFDEGLTAGMEYAWRIRAVGNDGQAGYYCESSPLIMPDSSATFSTEGMRLWLRPDTLGKSGGLPSWVDVGGAGNTTMTLSSAVPRVRADSLNGWATVQFDGTTYGLVSHGKNHDTFAVMRNAAEGEIFVVVKAAPGATANRLMEFGTSVYTNYPDTASDIREGFGIRYRLVPSENLPLTMWNIYNVSAKPGEWAARLDGVELDRAPLASCDFGYGSFKLGPCFNGEVAEVMVFDRVLSGAERNNITLRLHEKYDLADQAGQRPANLTATPTGGNQIALSWDGVPGVNVTYVIERRSVGGEYIQIGTSAKTAFLDNSAQAGIRYEYRVADATQVERGLYAGPVGATTSPAQVGRLPVAGSAPVLWLKSDNLNPGSLAKWRDDSGSGNHALHPGYPEKGNTNPPDVVYSEERGGMVVKFDPMKRQYYNLGDVMDEASAGEIFAIVRATDPEASSSASPRTLWSWSYAGSNGGYPIAWLVDDDFGRRDSYADASFRATVARIDEWNLYNVSAKTNEWVARFNGIEQHRVSNISPISFSQHASLGAGWGEGFFSGEIAEIMAFDRVLSPEERSDLEQYFLNRHDIWQNNIVTVPAPVDLKAEAVAYSKINLSWGHAGGPVQPVEIQRREKGGEWAVIATCQPGTLAYTDTALSPNKTYNYRLHVVNSSVESGYSNMVSVDNVPVLTPPEKIQIVLGSGLDVSNYRLYWRHNTTESVFVPPVLGYNLYIDDVTAPVSLTGAVTHIDLSDARVAGRLAYGSHSVRIQAVYDDGLVSAPSSVFYLGRDPVRIPSENIYVQHDGERNLSSYSILLRNDDGQARDVAVRLLVTTYDSGGNATRTLLPYDSYTTIVFAEGQTEFTIGGVLGSFRQARVQIFKPRLLLGPDDYAFPSTVPEPAKQVLRLQRDAGKIICAQIPSQIRGWVESQGLPVKIIVTEGATLVNFKRQPSNLSGSWQIFTPGTAVLTDREQVALEPLQSGRVTFHLACNLGTSEFPNWLELPETDTTVMILPRHMLQSVAFLNEAASGYLEVWSDDAGTAVRPSNASLVNDPPQWLDLDGDGMPDGANEKNQSVAYVRGSTPRLQAVLNIPGLDAGQRAQVKVRVTRMALTAERSLYEVPVNEALVTGMLAAGGGKVQTSAFALEHGIPADTIRYYDKTRGNVEKGSNNETVWPDNPAYKLRWDVDIGDGVWRNAGMSSHTMYVTYGSPYRMSHRQETLFWLSCKNAHRMGGDASTELIIKTIWQEFTDRKVSRVNNNTPMLYWGPWSTTSASITQTPDSWSMEGLLLHGDGRCGAWAPFFNGLVRLHGIENTFVAGILTAGKNGPPELLGGEDNGSLYVKNWAMPPLRKLQFLVFQYEAKAMYLK